MTSRLLTFCLAATLSSTAIADHNVLSPLSYGKVRFGSKLSDVEVTLGQRATPERREKSCDFVSFKMYKGVRFMVEEGVVTRADAEAGVPNSAGVAVGMPFARVKTMHPKIRIEPHKYDESGHYLILPSSDNRAALVFEESEGKITDARAGVQPSVQYVEGCL